MTSKRCGKCGETKPTNEFNRRSAARDGLQAICRSCAKGAFASWYEENKVANNERVKEWQNAHSERVKEQRRQRYQSDPERYREEARTYRAENREEVTARERIARDDRRKRAEDYLGGECVDCGATRDQVLLEFDHVDPSLKSYNPAAHLNRKWDTVVKELDKCVLRCEGCHKERTRAQQRGRSLSGSGRSGRQ